ncbi:hypothetical protein THRCLA_06095 [Thraustotheca clavata]|uniref:N-acetyltransferase domain-containing protein n=1 Tax=Thraustotheca clavata TaxID=74557 RepID=A0A1V9ZQF5_9STRA|nr:hypothetical protein THRCLA_06095 [Thraustotheca clavata]
MEQEKNYLPDDVLQKAASNPVKPASFELEGKIVKIRPFHTHDKAETQRLGRILYEASSGRALGGYYGDNEYDAEKLIWRYMLNGPYANFDEFEQCRMIEIEIERTFVVFDAATDSPIGIVSLMNHSSQNLRVEIGNTWYVPAAQGKGANRETVYLLLRHLFEELGYRRVEWRCDNNNIRSRKAALSLGFTHEGVLRQHMIIKGLNRDTAVHAALNTEWPDIKTKLETKLSEYSSA